MKKSDESTLANKLSVIFQILTRSIFRPKLMRNLIEERNQTKDENKWKNHLYKYDFDSIEEFFLKKFPDVDIKEYEKEIIQLEKQVDVFFEGLKDKKYPSPDKPYPIDYSINPNTRRFLYILCRILKPKNIIETGVAYGLSSLYILKALDTNNSGMLYSIDSVFRPWQNENMIGKIIPDNLKNKWKLNLGKSSEKLYEIFNQINDIDIFIHDSLHTYKNMIFEFECAEKNLKNNGIIISDDVLGNDAFYNFSNEKKLKSYLINVKNDSGLGIITKNLF